jgi:hypothetical protein
VFFAIFTFESTGEALVSERALDVGSVAFKAMSTKNNIKTQTRIREFLNRFAGSTIIP